MPIPKRSTQVVLRRAPRQPIRRKYQKKPKRNTFVPRMLGNKFVTRLRYGIEEDVTLTSTSGSFAQLTYEVTSLYDPRTAIGGHQPRGFDQLMAFFDHYQVIGAMGTFKLIATNEQATQQPVMCYLVLNDQSGALGSRSEAIEQKFVKSTCITQDDRMVTMKMPFSSKKFFGRGKGLLNDKQLHGSAAASPTENAWYHICVECINSGGTATVNLMGYIDFICVFTEPKLPPLS